jgi:hypothetical protein
LPHCWKCGKELPPETKFCTYCGTALAAAVPPPVMSAARKASHTKRNILVIVIVVLFIGVIMAASSTPRNIGTSTTAETTTELQSGSLIRIGEPFNMKMGSDEVPVQFTFTSARLTLGYDYTWADQGYKFLLLSIHARNMGNRETSLFSIFSKWEVTVDKGYVYEAKDTPFSLVNSIKPEEEIDSELTFMILTTTSPTEVRYYSTCMGSTANCDVTFLLDVKGIDQSVQVYEKLSLESCQMVDEKARLEIKNEGAYNVTIDKILLNGTVVSNEKTILVAGHWTEVLVPVNLKQGTGYGVEIMTVAGNSFTFDILPRAYSCA